MPMPLRPKVQAQIDALEATEHGFSALILCPFFANEGFPDLPHGWLDPTVAVVRRAGGVIIADEVQPGFGRLGTRFLGVPQDRLHPRHRHHRQTDGATAIRWRRRDRAA